MSDRDTLITQFLPMVRDLTKNSKGCDDLYSMAVLELVEVLEKIDTGVVPTPVNLQSYLRKHIQRFVRLRIKQAQKPKPIPYGLDKPKVVQNPAPDLILEDEWLSHPSLSERERILLRMTLDGYTTLEIAQALSVSPARVDLMKYEIYTRVTE
jgi:DNA-directed RNA polymerase specialized sigma subunit